MQTSICKDKVAFFTLKSPHRPADGENVYVKKLPVEHIDFFVFYVVYSYA